MFRLTRQLVARQTEGIPDDLLVYLAPELKKDLVDGDSRSPVIKAASTFPHTHLVSSVTYSAKHAVLAHLVSLDEDANIAVDSLVQPVFLAS